jgi:hypothetical protein
MNASLTDTASGRRNLNMRPLAHAASLPTTKLAAAAMAHWPACGDVEVITPARNGVPARRARLQVSFGALISKKTHWVAHFRQADAPQSVKPLDWFLVSERRLRSVEDACALLGHRPDLVTRHRAGCQE